MKTRLFFSILCLVFATTSVAAPSADLLLKDSDRSRGGNLKGITWDIEIKTEDDGEVNTRDFSVKAKGVDALVEATSPARNKGEIFLFNDRAMWFLKPGLRKPVSISARQKLSGQAANGDIASTNYVGDYDGKITKTEKIDGVDTYVLELKAKAKNVTYDQIRYWINSTSHLGVKAEFLTLQGMILKRATFEYNNHINHEGQSIPFVSKMNIIDAKFSKNKSAITYMNPKEEAHPASLFNINNVNR